MLSPETTAAVLALTFALIVASVITLIERYSRERGEVRCVAWDWNLTFLEVGSQGHQAVFSFEAYLFNETPAPTSLRGASVVFLRDGARDVSARLRHSSSDACLGELELPSRQGVHLSLYALLGGEEARELLAGFQRVSFVGRFPDSSKLERRIAERGDFVASWKRVGARRKDFVGSPKRTGARRKDFVASRKRVGARRKIYRTSP